MEGQSFMAERFWTERSAETQFV